jgi:hypothetical protein
MEHVLMSPLVEGMVGSIGLRVHSHFHRTGVSFGG